MDFIDRTEEKTRLNRLFDARTGSLACLYGRRRCGKTRLLRECIKDRANVFYHLADKADRSAQISRFVHEVSQSLPAFRAADGGDWGAVLDLWMNLAPSGSILVLDEFPYLVQCDHALPSVLQRVCDTLPESGKKIVICGSSQRMMQGFVLKQSEPLYGRAKEILPVNPIPFGWMKTVFQGWTPFERLKGWGVWGGVPRYWELQLDDADLWSAVRRHVTSPLGVLHNEPQFLLLDDFGDVAPAATVLSFIGDGVHRAGELASRMRRPVTDMARPLNRLVELGLITKETPFGDGERGKKSLYRISDPFLDFWYTFVRANWSRHDFLETKAERKAFDGLYLPYLGFVWERLVRETLAAKELPGLQGRWRKVARWWGNGVNRRPLEFDVVAESADGQTLLVGEAKLSLSKVTVQHEMAELQVKAGLLPFADRYKRIVTRLFVAHDAPEGAVSIDWCEVC